MTVVRSERTDGETRTNRQRRNRTCKGDKRKYVGGVLNITVVGVRKRAEILMNKQTEKWQKDCCERIKERGCKSTDEELKDEVGGVMKINARRTRGQTQQSDMIGTTRLPREN